MASKRLRHDQFMHRIVRAICMQPMPVHIARMRSDIHAGGLDAAECGSMRWLHGGDGSALRYRIGPSISQHGNTTKQRFGRLY